MIRRKDACSWLLVLGGVACGGNTVGTKPEPEPPTTAPVDEPEPRPGTAGTTSTEPSPGAAGTSATLPDPICNGPQPVCLRDCTSLERDVAECYANDQYRCPDGFVDLDSCPADACARRSLNCCSPNGAREFPECTAEGSIGKCPDGFRQASTCLPVGFDIETCDDLEDGTACTSEEQICFKDRCGRNCRCVLDEAGKLSWRCLVNLC